MKRVRTEFSCKLHIFSAGKIGFICPLAKCMSAHAWQPKILFQPGWKSNEEFFAIDES